MQQKQNPKKTKTHTHARAHTQARTHTKKENNRKMETTKTLDELCIHVVQSLFVYFLNYLKCYTAQDVTRRRKQCCVYCVVD